MSSMLAVIVFIAVHVSVTTEVHIDIKGEMKQGNNITLECSTNATDLTFSFQSKVDESRDVNIAECVFQNPGCFFLNETHLAMYNISLTEYGGILTIKNLSTEHYGLYTCFETYPPKTNASVRVEANDINNFAMDHTATLDTNLVIVIVVSVIMGSIIVTIIVVRIIICWRRKTTKRVPTLPQDVSNDIDGTAVPAFSNDSYKVQDDDEIQSESFHLTTYRFTDGHKNTQPSFEEFDVAHVQNGLDDRETAMKNIGIAFSDQGTTTQNSNDRDEQPTTPLLENTSETTNEIGPINDTLLEIKLQRFTAERPDPEVEHLSHEEDAVDIDNTDLNQLAASELTRESITDGDSDDIIGNNMKALSSPGTTSLYRSGRNVQIKH